MITVDFNKNCIDVLLNKKDFKHINHYNIDVNNVFDVINKSAILTEYTAIAFSALTGFSIKKGHSYLYFEEKIHEQDNKYNKDTKPSLHKISMVNNGNALSNYEKWKIQTPYFFFTDIRSLKKRKNDILIFSDIFIHDGYNKNQSNLLLANNIVVRIYGVFNFSTFFFLDDSFTIYKDNYFVAYVDKSDIWDPVSFLYANINNINHNNRLLFI